MTESDFDYIGKMPHPKERLLVIAGKFGFNPLIPGENDGSVGVSETCLDTPHKHMVLNSGHKGILFSKDAFINAYQFLEKQ